MKIYVSPDLFNVAPEFEEAFKDLNIWADEKLELGQMIIVTDENEKYFIELEKGNENR